MTFGNFLLDRNVVSREIIAEALEVQQISRRKLGRMLVELGFLTEEQNNSELSAFLKIDFARDLVHVLQASSRDVKVEAVMCGERVGYLMLTKSPVLYLREFDDCLVEKAESLAVSFEIKLISEDQMAFLASRRSNFVIEGSGIDKQTETLISDSATLIQTPYGDLLKDLLKMAKEQGASDIHFDVHRNGLLVRFRLNGDLVEVKSIKLEYAQSLLTEVKRRVGLPLTIIGAPCGGSARFDELNLKVRAQSNGQIHGETVVLRLIDEDKTKNATIDSIGDDFANQLKSALKFENGLILICGQTGSGKSWTLFSVLMSMDRQSQKVITIEDPVEYEGDGLMQIEVAEGRIGFLDALKSCLRLDPDVIMIGEIRDEETAQLAFKASSTGHLVLSTLHTNGAIEAIGRLKGLGIDDEVIRSNVKLISALSLKKRLCEVCKREVSQDEVARLSESLGFLALEGARFFTRNGSGCPEAGCFRGVVGRTLLSESVDCEAISQFLDGGVVPGYRTLHQCAIENAANGKIGVEDAI